VVETGPKPEAASVADLRLPSLSLDGKPHVQPDVVLRIPAFRALWLGLVISQVGDSFLLIAALQVVQAITSSPLAVGIMALSVALPQVLFGLIAGVLVDRLDRKLTMVLADLVRGVAVLGLLLAGSHAWMFYVVGFVLGTMGTLHAPARNAMLPDMVGRKLLLPANTLVHGSQICALVVGPTLAGLFVGLFGPQAAFGFDALTFFMAAALIGSVHVPQFHRRDGRISVRLVATELREGLHYMAQSSTILNISAIAAVAMLALAGLVVLSMPYLAEIGVGEVGFGILVSTAGVGAVAGGLVAGQVAERWPPGQAAGFLMATLAVTLMLFGLQPSYPLTLMLAFVVGACMVGARAVLAAMLQAIVPTERRGRVESVVTMIVSGCFASSMVLTGMLGQVLSVAQTFVIAGAVTMAAAVTAFSRLRGIGPLHHSGLT
jgi:MFS family permease